MDVSGVVELADVEVDQWHALGEGPRGQGGAVLHPVGAPVPGAT